MFFHLQFSSEVSLLAVKSKQQFDLSSTLSPKMLFSPPPKKKSKTKQNKIQSLSNLRYFWIAYRLCYDERCENEQCNIIDTKMLSTTIALYFNRVLNSKDIYCCARLKLCGRNSKSFCSSQGLSLFILPCRMRQIKETKALKHRKENAYSWEWLKLSIVSLKDENFSPNCSSLTFWQRRSAVALLVCQ